MPYESIILQNQKSSVEKLKFIYHYIIDFFLYIQSRKELNSLYLDKRYYRFSQEMDQKKAYINILKKIFSANK